MEATKIYLKFEMITRLTQNGKTFVAMSNAKKEKECDTTLGRSMFIYFTMNNKGHNLQTVARTTDAWNTVVFNSTPTRSDEVCHYKHITSIYALDGLTYKDATICPEFIVACGNAKRFKELTQYIMDLNIKENHAVERVFIFYDELHKYINPTLAKQIKDLHELDIVHRIYGVTATSEKLYTYFPKIHINKLDPETYSEGNYVTWGTEHFVHIPIDMQLTRNRTTGTVKTMLAYVKAAFEKHRAKIFFPGSTSFVPGRMPNDSHMQIKKLVWEYCPTAHVVIINQDRVKLYQKMDGEEVIRTIEVKGREDYGAAIARSVHPEASLVITGFKCIEMGQTLMHKDRGTFTSAIFSHIDMCDDDIYQLGGRITGNTLLWTTFKTTFIFCPHEFYNVCERRQQGTRELVMHHHGKDTVLDDYMEPIKRIHEEQNARKPCNHFDEENMPCTNQAATDGTGFCAMHSKICSHVPCTNKAVAGKELCKECMSPKKVDYRIFADVATAQSYCKGLGRRWINKTYKPNAQGLIEVGLNKTKKVYSVYDVIYHVKGAYGGGKKKTETEAKEGWRTCLVGYTNVGDPTTARYVVIIRTEEIDTEIVRQLDAKFPSLL